MDYYYIISAHYLDFYNILYGDLKGTDYATFIDDERQYKMVRHFFIAEGRFRHFEIGKPFAHLLGIIRLKCYFRRLLAGTPRHIQRYCFIIPAYIVCCGGDKYIRKKYPGSKIVCVFTDLLEIHYWNKLLIKTPEKTDIIYSYDVGEAKEYGMRFMNLPCSDLTPYIAGIKQEYDLSFVGVDKGRLTALIHICKNLKSRGFTCNFHMVKVPKEKQVILEGMHYHDDFLSFTDCLKISASSKCILELIQPGSQGNTTRVAESISMGRKLLSVNPHIVNNEYFVPENMLYFQAIEEVPDEFFLTGYREPTKEIRDRIRPETFLRHIERDLNELNQQKESE